MDDHVLARLSVFGFGENAELEVTELHTPEEFQRKLRPRNWSLFVPALFGRLIIAVVNGTYYVVDGQHRLDEARRNSTFKKVPCVVFKDMTMEQAAAMFDLVNSERKALAAMDNFRAACCGDVGNARELDEALLDRGLDGWGWGRGERNLGSIGSVVKLADDLGVEHASYALDVINAIWPFAEIGGDLGNSNPLHVRLVRGFGQFLRPEKRIDNRKRLRRWNRKDESLLVAFVRANYPGEMGLDSFLLKAQQERLGGGGGGGSAGMEILLAKLLNKARRRASLQAKATPKVTSQAI